MIVRQTVESARHPFILRCRRLGGSMRWDGGADAVFTGEGEVTLAFTEAIRPLGATPAQIDRNALVHAPNSSASRRIWMHRAAGDPGVLFSLYPHLELEAPQHEQYGTCLQRRLTGQPGDESAAAIERHHADSGPRAYARIRKPPSAQRRGTAIKNSSTPSPKHDKFVAPQEREDGLNTERRIAVGAPLGK